MAKTQQLQIRVSAEEKARIQERAAMVGMDVSKWLLRQALPPVETLFQRLCSDLLVGGEGHSHVLAELNDLLSRLDAREFREAVAVAPAARLPAFEAAYVASMVEQAAALKRVPPPEWTAGIRALERPWFATSLRSLRLHLLTRSPVPFRRRNLFVDSSLGDRV